MDGKRLSAGAHSLCLENRNRLAITEVLDVGRFQEEEILVNLAFGSLLVKGQNLHIQKLDPETSTMVISGTIQSMSYTEKRDPGEGGLLKKIFK